MIRYRTIRLLVKLFGLTYWIDEDGDLLVQRKPLEEKWR
jgi:hypothetical protein